MKNWHLLILAFLLSLGIAGCGGGGGGDDGGGGGGDGEIDSQLVGQWEAISVTEGVAIVPIGTALGWQSGVTKQALAFTDAGEATRGSSNSAGVDVLVEHGTITAENQEGTLTFGSEVTNFNYMAYWDGGQPWVLDLTYSKNGHNYIARYIKLQGLTAHNDSLLRAYAVLTSTSPSPITVDGSEVAAADYFNLAADSTAMVFQYLPDGTYIRRELKYNVVVNRQTGTWASGGGIFIREVPGETCRGYFDAEGWNTTLVNEIQGKTVRITWGRWGNLGNHPSELLGKWQPTGVTKDSVPINLSDFFGWESGVTSMTTEFWSDGSVESMNYMGTTVNENELGVWTVNGGILMVSMTDDMSANYSVTGNTATETVNDAGHIYVVTFTKV